MVPNLLSQQEPLFVGYLLDKILVHSPKYHWIVLYILKSVIEYRTLQYSPFHIISPLHHIVHDTDYKRSSDRKDIGFSVCR